MYVEKVMDSEMSGNIIDLCPVGALTSKPYAFQARPWELKKTESVDVLDAVGSNIRVDSRGVQVMRIQPKINDEVNEEWINDKTRYAYDGLKYQRLTTPLVREGDRFVPASWESAMETVRHGLINSGARGDEIKAVAGALADTEALTALKDLVNRLGSENLTSDQSLGDAPPLTGVDIRSNYLFNTGIENVGDADAVLLIGTNPRHEAAIINTRFRGSYLKSGAEFALIGENFDSVFEYEHLGTSPKEVASFLSGKGKGSFADIWKSAKKPLIVVGSAVTERKDGAEVLKAVSKHVSDNADKFLTPEWNGFSVLQRVSPDPPRHHQHANIRLHPEPLLLISVSPPPNPPPPPNLNSSTSSMPMTSTLLPSPKTHLSSTRATTVMLVPSLPMSVYLLLPTRRRAQHGSTLKVDRNWDESPSYHQEPHAKIGRSSEHCRSLLDHHYHMTTS
jgi:NADH dehydrogenase (ubiquinone) Fe-S protein 1